MSAKLKENLDLLMSEAGLNAEELSRRIGLPASTIKKIRNREDANPTLSTLLPLSKYFSLSISQLVGDEPFPESRRKGAWQINAATLTYIPLISWQASISWLDGRDFESINYVASEQVYGEKAFALLVPEDNWENLLKDTALLVDPYLQAAHRDFIIVHKQDQMLPTLKQVLFDEGVLYLKPAVQGYSIIPFTKEHRILGVVAEYKKYLKVV